MPSDAPDDMSQSVNTETPETPETPAIADDVEPVDGAPAPRRIGGRGEVERTRRRRLILLAILILLLAILSYVAYYYNANRRLPITRFVANEELVAPEFLYSFSGVAKQAMTRPTGIAIIGDRVYVADQTSRSIRIYSRPGVFQSEFSAVSDGKTTKLSAPVHIAIGPDETVWVTDRMLRKLFVFDKNGKFIRVVHPDGDPEYKWSPLALTLDKDGTLYVTDVGDSSNHRVLVLDPAGKVKATWGTSKQVTRANEAPGSFFYPNGIALKGTGATAQVFVADGNNRRVQVFTPGGAFIRFINTAGTPRGLWIDRQNRVYVADALAHRVDMYSDKGTPLVGFGENGIGPGQFNFPNDLVVDPSNGRIFVTDRENNQVQVWGFAVAEIPGITRVTPSNWWVCCLPWPFLLLPLLFRRRKFVATADFVEAMIIAELVPEMQRSRWRWIVTEADFPQFDGRSVDGIALSDLLHPEPYSLSDAQSLADRLSIDMDTAGLLAMAKRYRNLCTEDLDTARLAVALKVDVYDREAWVQRFAQRRKPDSGE